MSNREDLLTPVGRLVAGSLYDGNTTDAENRPLVYKTGTNAGQPRIDFYFALAIPKGSEQHWSQTEWGAKIYAVGVAGFPNGQTQAPTFAWKITDGDSQIPNKTGKKPCDREGYPGHWVLNFSSSFAPKTFNRDGSEELTTPYAINPGDYIQVYATITDNGSSQSPGVFLNPSMVALAEYGKRIILGVDPKAVGFGKAALPANAEIMPGLTPPVTAPVLASQPPQYLQTAGVAQSSVVPVQPAQPAPYPQILGAPVVPVPAPVKQRTMLPAAGGATYEQMIAAGWTDQLLIQHGMMQG